MKTAWLCAVATAALLAAGATHAQNGAEDAAQTVEGVTVYGPEAFADAAPANAADMLARVPGFVIVEADADVRGLAGAQGNVLIDGARPTSKREDIGDLLARIPAGSVERIEIIRAGAPGYDMAGHALLANVVRRNDSSVEAAVEAGLGATTEGRLHPGLSVEFGRRSGDQVLELAAAYESAPDDDGGRGRIIARDADGFLTEDSRTDVTAYDHEAAASISWRQPLAGGQFAANAAVRGERQRVDERIETTAPDPGLEIASEREEFLEAEAGARFVRRLGDRTTLEVVASGRQGRLDVVSQAEDEDDTERFEEETDTTETIGRIDLTHEPTDRLTLTGSLEGAINTLDGAAALTENGAAIDLPGTDVGIEERRAEAALGAVWRPRLPGPGDWVLEAGLRVETSTIGQSGDTPLERDFLYAKPRLAAAWAPDDFNDLRLSLSREVGQLDFSDFVAGASLTTGQVSVGNAALEPDKTWRLIAAWERRFGADTALTVTWTYDRIEDVIDRVLIVTPDDVFDAPGNIGDGRRDTLAVGFDAPLDRFGLTGGRLSTALLWRTSEVTDPVTGAARPISGEAPFEGSVEITQDLPAHRLSWGVALDAFPLKETEYQFDEVTREREAASWSLFVERRIGDQWRLRAEAENLFGRRFTWTRDKFDGPRSTEPLDEIERRTRRAPGWVGVSLRRSLGG